MLRSNSFLSMGMGIATAVGLALSGCGGEEFTSADPSGSVDGASDAKPPSQDRDSSGGNAGAGGSDGTGGAGGRGGGGTGGTGGSSGMGGDRGDSGLDRVNTDTPAADVPGPKDDTATDHGGPDASVGNDGAFPADADASRSVDGAGDGPLVDGQADTQEAAADGRTDTSTGADATDAGCQPITYYKDDDSDGFGKNSETQVSCVPPGGKWSVLGGDCRDDLPNVKPYTASSPDPPQYSGTGYAQGSAPQGVSFDYDCTGTEDADPSNAYGPEPACSGPLNCSGVGYVAVNPSRTGTGIDPYCGSTTLKRCVLLLAAGAPALCSTTTEVASAPYRCR